MSSEPKVENVEKKDEKVETHVLVDKLFTNVGELITGEMQGTKSFTNPSRCFWPRTFGKNEQNGWEKIRGDARKNKRCQKINATNEGGM